MKTPTYIVIMLMFLIPTILKAQTEMFALGQTQESLRFYFKEAITVDSSDYMGVMAPFEDGAKLTIVLNFDSIVPSTKKKLHPVRICTSFSYSANTIPQYDKLHSLFKKLEPIEFDRTNNRFIMEQRTDGIILVKKCIMPVSK